MKKKSIYIAIIIVIITGISYYYNSIPTISISPYPNGLNFAFTITDDPDESKLDKLKPVYDHLDKSGFRTTIACWVYKPVDLSGMPDPKEQYASVTLENYKYVKFLKKYQKKGFEIALHSVTAGNDKREITEKGYNKFKDIFGNYPEVNIMHSRNIENIYWGKNVFSNVLMKRIVDLYENRDYKGEVIGNPYFWGDICKGKTKYVRLWGTSDINTLKFNPSMPYYDEKKPYVNYWFSFSDGYIAKYFNKLLTKRNIDKLVRERGTCVVYTHFAAGFCHKDHKGEYQLSEATREALNYIAIQKQGWFVPVSKLLNRLQAIKFIELKRERNLITIKNYNSFLVEEITLKGYPFMDCISSQGQSIRANEEGEIIIGVLQPGEAVNIYINRKVKIDGPNNSPTNLEFLRMVLGRVKILIFNHRG